MSLDHARIDALVVAQGDGPGPPPVGEDDHDVAPRLPADVGHGEHVSFLVDHDAASSPDRHHAGRDLGDRRPNLVLQSLQVGDALRRGGVFGDCLGRRRSGRRLSGSSRTCRSQ